jgi:hypothetical protein
MRGVQLVFRVVYRSIHPFADLATSQADCRFTRYTPYCVLVHGKQSRLDALSLWFIVYSHVLPATLHFVAAYVAPGLIGREETIGY